MDDFIMGIDHVQLAAPKGCEEAARAFYRDRLGLVEIEKPELLRARGGVWFRCGAHQVHIGVEEAFHPARKAHPAFLVRSIRTFREKLLASGVAVRDDEAREDVVRFFVDDPFGNRIEFLEPMTTEDR